MAKSLVLSRTDDNDEETFLVIGIDFGTSQSGVAWAFSTSPDDVTIISSWKADSKRASDDEKCPSSISYDEDGKVTCWGFLTINDTGTRFKNFKLLLSQTARDDPKNKPLLDELAALEALRKRPVDVVADYLHCLWQHTLRELNSTSRTDTKLAIDNSRFKVVLTVPAIWDHAAQDLTRRAAKKAGILVPRLGKKTTLEMISEPEAAALAFFNDANLKGQIGLKASFIRDQLDCMSVADNEKSKDSFVVCDAGGGTVDLISYKIEKLSPLSLSMCSEPTGGTCGAVFLDNRFENQLRVSAGDDTFDEMAPRNKLDLMDKWEYGAKRVFRHDCNDNQDWSYYVGRRTAREVLLDKGHLNVIFNGLCIKIADLVSIQVKAVHGMTGAYPKAILLVGGFGENNYLREELEIHFPDVKVQQLDRAISAICRGAVARGISDRAVLNHISRYNYGLSFATSFVEGEHMAKYKVEDSDFPGTYQVYLMQWYLKRGQSIAHQQPQTLRFSKCFWRKEELRSCKIEVRYSESKEPEKYQTKDVKLLCSIDASFDENLWDPLPFEPSEAQMKRLFFHVTMKVTAGSLAWSIACEGQTCGERKVVVVYE